MILTCLAGACGDDSTTDAGVDPDGSAWGPLAVVPPPDGSDDALIAGTLEIGDRCVLLDERGEDVLLVWPSDRTVWNAVDRTIGSENTTGGSFEMTDGAAVSLGGGGESVDEGGRPADEFLSAIDWESAPDAACVADVRWFLGDVVSVDGS